MDRHAVEKILAEARAKGSWADLSWADLSWADLAGADLTAATGGILRIDGLPSGQVTLVPTPDGWVLDVGCWRQHTTDDLRTLIAGTDWPEAATSAEQDRRRPGLAAVADLCDVYAAAHPDLVPTLKERWG